MVLKMAAVRHLGFVKFEFFNGRSGQGTDFASPYQILWRSVKPLRRYRAFCDFSRWRPPFWISKIQNFNGRCAVRGQYASLYQILSKTDKRLQRYSDLTVFSKWRPSAILDLLGAYWDHPRRPLDGLYRCAKFGWNRCSSFDNMKLSIFCPFGLKTPIHAPKIGVFGGFHP